MDKQKPYLTIFASTLKEIAPLLSCFDSISYNPNQKAYHIKEIGSIFITGIGPYSAHRSATRAISYTREYPHKIWLNIGVCGSLHIEEIGKIIEPRTITLLSWHPTVLFTEEDDIFVASGNVGVKLFTSPIPIYDASAIENCKRGYVDMEAYAITTIAAMHDIPCSIIKVVSDVCSQSSVHMIQARLPILQKRIASAAYAWVTSYC